MPVFEPVGKTSNGAGSAVKGEGRAPGLRPASRNRASYPQECAQAVDNGAGAGSPKRVSVLTLGGVSGAPGSHTSGACSHTWGVNPAPAARIPHMETETTYTPDDVGPIGVFDGHTRESQIASWKALHANVRHPDQRIGTVRLRVEISADGLSYQVNDSAWHPTYATTIRRCGLRPEFDQKKLAGCLRKAGFPFPRGKAKPGAVHIFERRLSLWLDCEQGECIEWIPGLKNFERLGHALVVFGIPHWNNEFVGALLPSKSGEG